MTGGRFPLWETTELDATPDWLDSEEQPTKRIASNMPDHREGPALFGARDVLPRAPSRLRKLLLCAIDRSTR